MEKQPLILYGAGGHGKVIADTLRFSGRYRLAGFVDDERSGEWCGLPILGTGEWLLKRARADHALILAVGDNERRRRLWESLREKGYKLGVAVHPSAQIGGEVSIGSGTVIMAQAVINAGTKIGINAIINTGTTVDHDCILEDYVHLAPGVHLAGGVVVRQLAQFGVGALAIPGVQVGESALIGAGAAVVRDVAPFVRAAGVPAKPIEPKDR